MVGRKAVLIGAVVAALLLLGLAVDKSFLLFAVVALCPLLHFFGGHGHSSHDHREGEK
ncbi:MAG: DUF2933 domain-containing protein [Thaumarchaeota archaeon]|nr:DUF2933 domain-containing protein [Nitrososphaerota archaeon]